MKRIMAIVCGCVSLGLAVGAARGGTIYVAVGGADTNTGASWAQALATIGNAALRAGSGDAILVSNGAYWVASTNSVTISNKSVTISGFSGNPGDVIVTAADAAPILFYAVNSTSVVFDSLTFSNGLYGVKTEANVTGVVRNCKFYGYHGSGGPVKLFGSILVDRCVFDNNSVGYYYNVIDLMGGTTLRNCLIVRNSGGYRIVNNYSGYNYIENCTIVGNSGNTSQGCGVTLCRDSGTLFVRNSIVWGNVHPLLPNYYSTAGISFSNTCTFPLPAVGVNNTAADPQFADQAGFDLRLRPASPCMNTGSNQPWMAGSLDLAGNPRTNASGRVDMGAYEYLPGALDAGFTATPLSACPAPLAVTFSGAAEGTNTSSARYYWDFNNDGVIETQGLALATVTNIYATAGVYSVALRVSNTVGEIAQVARTNYIKVSPSVVYVAKTGSVPQFPYDTWAKASSNIHLAVAAAADGATVLISNGVYAVTNQITVDNIAVRGFSGNYADTIVDGGKCYIPCFYMKNTGVVESLTTTNAAYGFYFYGAGTARRCLVSNNYGTNSAQYRFSCGVYMLFGGLAENCVIRRCGGGDYGGGAGLIYGGVLRNCLLAENVGTYGGGAYLQSGWLENCTIVSNTASLAGGIYCYGGVSYIFNSIIKYNTASVSSNYDASSPSLLRFWNSCTTPLPGYGVNNLTNDPLFTARGADLFHLSASSPCINTGVNLSWMTNATDLAGSPRILHGVTDIGAYEEGFTYLVWTNGTQQAPYDTWAKAFSNINDAVNAAWDYDIVLATNGVYYLTNQLCITNAITVQSANGRDVTIVDGNNYAGKSVTNRCVYMSNSLAVMQGFTLRRGNPQDGIGGGAALFAGRLAECALATNEATRGGGAYIGRGAYQRLENCSVVSNTSSSDGGGLYFENAAAGVVSNCDVSKNYAATGGGGIMAYGTGMPTVVFSRIGNNRAGNAGGGAYLWNSGGTLDRCSITGNVAGAGAGVYLRDVGANILLRNCLIGGNATDGVCQVGASNMPFAIQSCTIASNAGCGVKFGNGANLSLDNAIVYFNAGSDLDGAGLTNTIDYCCISATNSGWGAGNTTADPSFKDLAAGDFRLRYESPCANHGANRAWMTNAADLDGAQRILQETVNIGAYEGYGVWFPTSGIVNLKTDFGAAGDGIANDLQPLSNALQAVAGGGVLSVPEGAYRISGDISATLTRDVTVVGAGEASLKLDGSVVALVATSVDTTVSSPAVRGDTVIRVNSNAAIAAGKVLYIASDVEAETTFHTRKQDVHSILSVSNAGSGQMDVTLDTPLNFGYSSAEAGHGVTVYDGCRIVVLGLGLETTTTNSCLSMRGIRSGIVDRMNMKQTAGAQTAAGVLWERSVDGTMSDVSAESLMNAVILCGCRNMAVMNMTATNCAQPVMTCGFSDGIYVNGLAGNNNVATMGAGPAFNVNYEKVLANDDSGLPSLCSIGGSIRDSVFYLTATNGETDFQNLALTDAGIYSNYDFVVENVEWNLPPANTNLWAGLGAGRGRRATFHNVKCRSLAFGNQPIQAVYISDCALGFVSSGESKLNVQATTFDGALYPSYSGLVGFNAQYDPVFIDCLFTNASFVMDSDYAPNNKRQFIRCTFSDIDTRFDGMGLGGRGYAGSNYVYEFDSCNFIRVAGYGTEVSNSNVEAHGCYFTPGYPVLGP